jgi:1,4-dihydroxy-2-naphthoyl-CoA synthase
VFAANEALGAGLIQRVESETELAGALDEECARLLEAEPLAQRAFKKYAKQVVCGRDAEWAQLRKNMATMLAQVRAGAGAQEGLAKFFAKETPGWKLPWPPEK